MFLVGGNKNFCHKSLKNKLIFTGSKQFNINLIIRKYTGEVNVPFNFKIIKNAKHDNKKNNQLPFLENFVVKYRVSMVVLSLL